MPAANATIGFVCFRCRLAASIHAPFRVSTTSSPRFLPTRNQRPLHTATAPTIESNPVTENQAAPKKKRRPYRPHTKSWRALLENKALGQATSVLVLRDTERNRTGFEHSEESEQHNESESVNASEILSSIGNRNNEPTSAESEEGIESLRPKAPARDRTAPVQIPVAEFEKIVSRLVEGFSQGQLAQYVAKHRQIKNLLGQSHALSPRELVSSVSEHHTGADILQETKVETTIKRDEKQVLRSKWFEMDSSGKTIKKKKSKKSVSVTGGSFRKGVTARILMTEIWNIETTDDPGPRGRITLVTQEDGDEKLNLLLSGEKSLLEEVAVMYRAQVDVLKRKQKLREVRIVGTQSQCEKAADHVERLLEASQSTKIPIENLQNASLTSAVFATPRSMLLNKVATTAAALTRSNVQVLNNKPHERQFKINSTSLTDMEHCQRLIAASFNPDQILDPGVLRVTNSPEATMPITIEPGLRSMEFPWREYNFCRLAASDVEKKGPFHDRVPLANESNDLVRKLSKNLLLPKQGHGHSTEPTEDSPSQNLQEQNNGWSAAHEVMLVAESGRIFREHPEAPSQESMLVPLNQKSHGVRMFVPSLPVLPAVLSDEFRGDVGERKQTLHVRLIKSPRTNIQEKPRGVHPSLDLTLGFDPRSREIWVRSLSALWSTRNVGAMLPDMTHDVRFTSMETSQFVNPADYKSIKHFVRQIQDSAVGFGRITAPLHVDIPIGNIEDPVEYMAIGMEYRETLTWKWNGQDLVYKRVEAGELGASTESLLLTVPSSKEEVKKDAKVLVERYAQLLELLDAHVGARRPDSASGWETPLPT